MMTREFFIPSPSRSTTTSSFLDVACLILDLARRLKRHRWFLSNKDSSRCHKFRLSVYLHCQGLTRIRMSLSRGTKDWVVHWSSKSIGFHVGINRLEDCSWKRSMKKSSATAKKQKQASKQQRQHHQLHFEASKIFQRLAFRSIICFGTRTLIPTTSASLFVFSIRSFIFRLVKFI